MVRIIKQPRWAFWRYEETHEFEAPSVSEGLIEQRTAPSYSRPRVLDLVTDETAVRFSRGSTFGSLFSPSERHYKQNLVVTVTQRDGAATVPCQHLCWGPYPNLHTGARNCIKRSSSP
jgi:hypothetical protein